MSTDRANTLALIEELAQRRDQHVAAGIELVQRWRAAFPHGTLDFRLVRLGGESNTLLRWRSSGKGVVPIRGARFELIDARDVLAAMPDRVRQRVLDFEQRRIAINHHYALAAYQVDRLQTLTTRRLALIALRNPDA